MWHRSHAAMYVMGIMLDVAKTVAQSGSCQPVVLLPGFDEAIVLVKVAPGPATAVSDVA